MIFLDDFSLDESLFIFWPALIDAIFRALKEILPTLVEAERAFSAAGLFSTKICSRLSDAAIDSCCFLRNYLKNKD